ncbi:MAG: OmpA family protein [bacterium]
MFRGSAGDPEWGDTDSDQIEIDEYASTERTSRNFSRIESNDSLFSEETEKDRYLITYADLITLLLGLFILLYAISSIDVKKYENLISVMGNVFGTTEKIIGFDTTPTGVNEKIPVVKTLKQQLQDVIQENGYGKVVRLTENERGITISILDEILFPSGSADLNEPSKEILKNIANIIRELPNDIRIEGHTDNLPISSSAYPSNWHLSVARATNTAFHLMLNEGILQDKVSIVGYSEFQPVASNETEEGRAQNRRVDLVILKQY